MRPRVLASARPRAAMLTVTAVTALIALPVTAGAQAKPPTYCAANATAANGIAVALAGMRHRLAVLDMEFDGATAASPAAWRIQEDRDRLRMTYSLLGQLGDTLATRDGATPGSAAQWRAQESFDALCDQLRLA